MSCRVYRRPHLRPPVAWVLPDGVMQMPQRDGTWRAQLRRACAFLNCCGLGLSRPVRSSQRRTRSPTTVFPGFTRILLLVEDFEQTTHSDGKLVQRQARGQRDTLGAGCWHRLYSRQSWQHTPPSDDRPKNRSSPSLVDADSDSSGGWSTARASSSSGLKSSYSAHTHCSHHPEDSDLPKMPLGVTCVQSVVVTGLSYSRDIQSATAVA